MKVQIYSVNWYSRIHNRDMEVIFIGNINPVNPIDPEIYCKKYINDGFKPTNKLLGETKKYLKFEGIFNIESNDFWEKIKKLFPNIDESHMIDKFYWDL